VFGGPPEGQEHWTWSPSWKAGKRRSPENNSIFLPTRAFPACAQVFSQSQKSFITHRRAR
jgi:hypothetical protein